MINNFILFLIKAGYLRLFPTIQSIIHLLTHQLNQDDEDEDENENDMISI